MALKRRIYQKVKKTWPWPGASLWDIKMFLNSDEVLDMPHDSQVRVRRHINLGAGAKVKSVEIWHGNKSKRATI